VTTAGTTDTELLRRASGGDEASFLVLYQRHRNSVYRFACRMLGSSALAEDVTQECFLGLVRRPELYRGDGASLRTYLCAAARNISLAQIRRHARETAVDWIPDLCSPSADLEPLQRIIDGEARDAVRDAVQSLPPLQREALILFEYEEMSLAEIAVVAGTDVGTIKSRLHRAREHLRRLLEPWMTAASAPLMTAAKETP
jgi:RNA polymerase sigma-70 factor (ECF subfamily)